MANNSLDIQSSDPDSINAQSNTAGSIIDKGRHSIVRITGRWPRESAFIGDPDDYLNFNDEQVRRVLERWPDEDGFQEPSQETEQKDEKSDNGEID